MSQQLIQEYEEYKAQGRIWAGVPQESIKKIKYPRIDAKVVREFLALEDLTGTISDVLDSLGINGTVPSSYLSPAIPGSKLAGTAITLRSIPERKTSTQGLHDKDSIRMATRDTHYLAEPGSSCRFRRELRCFEYGRPVCLCGPVTWCCWRCGQWRDPRYSFIQK